MVYNLRGSNYLEASGDGKKLHLYTKSGHAQFMEESFTLRVEAIAPIYRLGWGWNSSDHMTFRNAT